MNTIASITVSTVTGANDYFTLEASTVEKYNLQDWVVSLLPKTSDCNGIIVESLDLLTARSNERKTWLLDFASSKLNPLDYPSAAEYIEHGKEIGLPLRYKCRVRSPWYRVPVVPAGTILMAKRAHQHPRLLLNQARVITTDTIYRGQMRAGYIGKEKDIVSGFHNSATLLSAEVEGRTYGGGVLELVPSEIARLTVPLLETGDALLALDKASRSAGGQKDDKDTLIDATDEILRKKCGAFDDIYSDIRLARIKLRERRFGI